MSAQSYSPSAKTLGSTVTIPADGDPIAQDNLYKEASPGATPKLTLGYLADCVKGVITDYAKKTSVNFWTNLQTFFAVAIQCALLADKGTITDASTTTIDVTKFAWIATSVSQQINCFVDATNAAEGHLLFVSRDPAGAFGVVFKRVGQAAAIVSLGSSDSAGAILIFRGGQWRLFMAGVNAVPGADA